MTIRCLICGWPLKEDQALGCVEGDCSYRPDAPSEQATIRMRRERVARVTEAVKAAWSSYGEEPFPLYDREAARIAAEAIRAYEAT